MQSRVTPFVVAVDGLGRVVASGPAEQGTVADDKMKRAALSQWVNDLRTVTTDGVAQRKAIDRVYSLVGSGTPAQVQISDYYRSNEPAKRAQTQTVEVEVKTIFPTTDTTYIVEWVETTRALAGHVLSEQRWKGAFIIGVNPPTEEKLMRVNPLGVYVTNVSWSRVI
jgi:type IV secretion system protein VirB5